MIFPDSKENYVILKNDRAEQRQTRFLPKEFFNPSIETNIFHNKVAYIAHSEREPFATVISNPAIALAERQKFELLWRIAGYKDTSENTKIQKTTQKVMFEREGKILMMKDTKGQWELPGGTIDFGEEMEAALHREIEEEMGLKRDQYQVDGIIGNFNIISHVDDRHYHYLALVYRGELKVDDFQLSSEHIESAWFSIPEILKLKMVEGYKEFFEKL